MNTTVNTAEHKSAENLWRKLGPLSFLVNPALLATGMHITYLHTAERPLGSNINIEVTDVFIFLGALVELLAGKSISR